ncbi:hypothetical protein AHAS_Ahas13G0234300 [Arachis hypogaea]
MFSQPLSLFSFGMESKPQLAFMTSAAVWSPSSARLTLSVLYFAHNSPLHRHFPPPHWATCCYKFITHRNTPASLQ